MDSGIYKITHVASGVLYVGSAVNIKCRWAVHVSELNGKYHHSKWMQRVWNKYGAEAFAFEVIEHVEISRLIEREQYWIDALAAYGPRGFNGTPKAGNTLGFKYSDESRRKMSESRKGRKHSDEARKKMSLYRKGRKHSPEHSAKIGAAQKGRKINEATRAAVAESNRRRGAEIRRRAAEHQPSLF